MVPLLQGRLSQLNRERVNILEEELDLVGLCGLKVKLRSGEPDPGVPLSSGLTLASARLTSSTALSRRARQWNLSKVTEAFGNGVLASPMKASNMSPESYLSDTLTLLFFHLPPSFMLQIRLADRTKTTLQATRAGR